MSSGDYLFLVFALLIFIIVWGLKFGEGETRKEKEA